MDEERLRRAYRYCGWITARHYENFPVGSWLLPRAVRPHVAAIYAFARSADDFADEQRYQGRSLQLLERWRRDLHASTRNGAGHPIFIALADTIRRFDLPLQLLDDLLTAFTMDVTKRRYSDWEELLNYCRHSANPVGRLVLLLFGIREDQMHEWSDRICSGLQLANHWQDLRIDLERDILYIPQTLLRSFGVTEQRLRGQTLGSGSLPPSCRLLMADLVGRARRLFDEGAPLIGRVRGRLRLELALTLAGGRAILDRIERADYDVFRHRPVLSGWDKLNFLAHAALS